MSIANNSIEDSVAGRGCVGCQILNLCGRLQWPSMKLREDTIVFRYVCLSVHGGLYRVDPLCDLSHDACDVPTLPPLDRMTDRHL